VHLYGHEPALSVAVIDALLPGFSSGVFLAPILKSCESLPLLVTLKTTVPCGTVFFESRMWNSVGLPIVTVTVVELVAFDCVAAIGATARPTAATKSDSSRTRNFIVWTSPRDG